MADLLIGNAPLVTTPTTSDKLPVAQSGSTAATAISVAQILSLGPTTLPASDVSAWAKAATKPNYTATEVGLGNVTNDAQVKRTEMAAALGVATLDGTGKLTPDQTPAALVGAVVYQGVWNAATNTPALVSSVGTKGWYYKTSVAGTTLIDGISQWGVGDTIIFNGTTWDKIDGIANEVLSVAGKTGAVTLTPTDVSLGAFEATAANIKMDGVQSVGALASVARGDHIHPTDTSRAATSGTLAQFASTTSAQLAGVISNGTGTGSLVFNTSPTLVTPALGTPASGVLTNCTGLPTAGLVDGSVTNAKLAFDGGRSPYAFFKADATSVAFTKTGAGTLSIKAGTYVLVGTSNTMVSWAADTVITMPIHAIGTDYYIYACADGTCRADASATAPTGYTTANSRQIGGYHYGRIRNTLTVTDVATEIVPRSLWDLTYRPKCNPAGMVDVYGTGLLWADIYQAAVDSAITLTSGVLTAGTAKSIYNGTPLTGTEGLHGYNFIELARNSGKRLLTHSEWLAVAHGSPQGNASDNLNAWSATTNSARNPTGQVACAVSLCGVCDCVGNVWEWLDEFSNRHDSTTWAWQNVMSGQNVGQLYLPNSSGLVMYLAGGSWADGANTGARALSATICPWYVNTSLGSRFACDGL